MLLSNEYNPFYIAPINGCLLPNKKRLGAFVSYECLGNSYFEGGTIPSSLARVRLIIAQSLLDSANGDTGMVIVQVPEPFADRLTAARGLYIGKKLSVLVSKSSLARFGDSLWSALVSLTDRSCHLEEPICLDAHFRPSRYMDGFYDAWHDIKNDLFFSFSEEYLKAIQSALLRPFDIETPEMASYFASGSFITGIKPQEFKGNEYEAHAHCWREVEGRIVGMTENHVTLKSHGRTTRLPWFLVTSPIPGSFVIPEQIERLKAEISRLPSYL